MEILYKKYKNKNVNSSAHPTNHVFDFKIKNIFALIEKRRSSFQIIIKNLGKENRPFFHYFNSPDFKAQLNSFLKNKTNLLCLFFTKAVSIPPFSKTLHLCSSLFIISA